MVQWSRFDPLPGNGSGSAPPVTERAAGSCLQVEYMSMCGGSFRTGGPQYGPGRGDSRGKEDPMASMRLDKLFSASAGESM